MLLIMYVLYYKKKLMFALNNCNSVILDLKRSLAIQ